MSVIQHITAREILDSRGQPTIEAVVSLSSGETASASVPSGASTGRREAVDLRDHQDRYRGQGVLQAIANVQAVLAPALCGESPLNQVKLDQIMITLDGTNHKQRLGANAILAVSIAMKRVAAKVSGKPLFQCFSEQASYSLPVPMINVINGGAHADNPLMCQEFMVIPIGAQSFAEAIRHSAELFYSLKDILQRAGYQTAVGDEGGFAPALRTEIEALDCLMKAMEQAGFKPSRDIVLALDMAASEFYQAGCYHVGSEGILASDSFAEYLKTLVEQYPIISIEDGMAEDDIDGWLHLTQLLGQRCQLVGDDLFVTNKQYLEHGIAHHLANAILIKPNQIGTLTEAIHTLAYAKQEGYRTIVSHRSGETEDSFLADFAVGISAGQIKTGSVTRSERTCKYNQILRIEQQYADLVSFNPARELAPWLINL